MKPVLLAALITAALIAPHSLLAQYTISTVAGGGPNGLAALSSSIGYPGSIAFDSTGNAYIADAWSSRVLKVTPGSSTGSVTVVAGNGSGGYSGDGGPATSASLDTPVGVALDSSGNIYIADTGNSLIREVTISNGQIQTVAGSYTAGPGYSGDSGPATSAQLNGPAGVFVDGSGNIFIADSLNDAVREVTAATSKIQTVAGNGTYCADPTSACGDNGPATSANLDLPSGVFVDASGNIFIADTYTARIRVVNPGTAAVTIAGVQIPAADIATIAGAYYNPGAGESCGAYPSAGGPSLTTDLCGPTGVFVDASENIFIADFGYSVVWEIASGGTTIAPVAGNGTAGFSGDTGAATSAQLNSPNNISVDGSGDIFIADTDNFVIREVSSSNINTVIGNNTQGDSGDGGAATNAQLNIPGGVFLDPAGDIFIADSFNSVIREVVASSGNIQTVAGDPKTPCEPGTATYPTCGDGASALAAQLNSPNAVAVDAASNIYIADSFDNRIRVVNSSTGDIAAFAGTGTACSPSSYSTCGDGNAATTADLFQPLGIALDSAGNLFIADTDDQTVRVVNNGASPLVLAGVTIAPGAIETIAGNATQCPAATSACGDGAPSTSAQLNFPAAIYVDSSDNLYITDSGDNRIRVVNTGTAAITVAAVTIQPGFIATVAGTGLEGYSGDGAAATSAQLANPGGIFVDSSGNIYISDTYNYVTREVVASTGFIGTIAGNNTQGFSGDGGSSSTAQINSALAVFGDSAADIYIADTGNSRIRKLTPSSTSQPSATPPPAQTVSAGGTANYDIQLTAHTGDPRYAVTLSCAPSSLPANATCSFSPSKVTPGPAPVPFTLTVSVPTASAALEKPSGICLPLVFAFVPLAGILFSGAMSLKNRRSDVTRAMRVRRAMPLESRWLLFAAFGISLLLLNACGGGSSGSSSGSGTTYTIQVQGTTAAQSTPFTITTASLTVQ